MEDQHIVVVIGPDPAFEVDLNVFDMLRETVGVPYTRLMQPSLQDLINQLRVIRVESDRVVHCHIAAHMEAKGIHFGDKLVNANDLSVHLSGVEILVLAGCESFEIGSMLPVVPYVVSLLEKVDNNAAAFFTRLFWYSVALGYPVPTAFSVACDRLPDVARFAWLHDHHFLARKPI